MNVISHWRNDGLETTLNCCVLQCTAINLASNIQTFSRCSLFSPDITSLRHLEWRRNSREWSMFQLVAGLKLRRSNIFGIAGMPICRWKNSKSSVIGRRRTIFRSWRTVFLLLFAGLHVSKKLAAKISQSETSRSRPGPPVQLPRATSLFSIFD